MGSAARRPSYFENRRCDLTPFKPCNTVSVARRLETEVVARSSWPSCVRFRFELERVYGGCDKSSSGSGSSKLSINAGGRYGSGLGANNGALHTTWRNSGAGVGGATVDIGDPGSEGDTVYAEKPGKWRSGRAQMKKPRYSHSSRGIGREIGSIGRAESAGGWR
jgi:hypothetical protein